MFLSGVCLTHSLLAVFLASMARGQRVRPPKAPENTGPQPSHPKGWCSHSLPPDFALPRREPLAWLLHARLDPLRPRAGPCVSVAAPTFSLSLLCKPRQRGQFPEAICRRPLFSMAWGCWGRRGSVALGLHGQALFAPTATAPEGPSSHQRPRQKTGLPRPDSRGWNMSEQEAGSHLQELRAQGP